MKTMKLAILSTVFCMLATLASAQQKLTIDKVYKAYLRNSGDIRADNQIKGYFFFYQSDKIDRKTNEYTLKIVDQNLNPVKDIKFTDSKYVTLLEASYNNDALAFLFYNDDEKTTEVRIYGLDGKQRSSYVKEIDKKTKSLWTTLIASGMSADDNEGGNSYLFDVDKVGFTTVLPLREGKNKTYQVDFYSSEKKSQWSYVPTDEERWAFPSYLGSTDSLVILEVLKKPSALSTKFTSDILALNIHTKKVQYELDGEKEQYKIVPMNIVKLRDSRNILIMASYYDKEDNIVNDASLGIAMYEVSPAGKIVSKKHNQWTGDLSKYLPINDKGRLDKIGWLYTHKIVQTPTGKFFAIAEGYKKNISAGGVALAMLAAAGGGYSNAGLTKMMVTDIVVMEFDSSYKVKSAKIYDKRDNAVVGGQTSDYASQHALAMMIKNIGGFDYEFTTGDIDYETFSFCYSDYEKSKEYKGQTFNAVRYNGEKLTTDKIELASKANMMRVYPAKPGFVMILEYFKKDKKLEMRLEKMN